MTYHNRVQATTEIQHHFTITVIQPLTNAWSAKSKIKEVAHLIQNSWFRFIKPEI